MVILIFGAELFCIANVKYICECHMNVEKVFSHVTVFT